MPDEPQPPKKLKWGKPVNDGFVVTVIDGFDQLTPEQKTWPVVSLYGKPPKKDIEAPPEKS